MPLDIEAVLQKAWEGDPTATEKRPAVVQYLAASGIRHDLLALTCDSSERSVECWINNGTAPQRTRARAGIDTLGAVVKYLDDELGVPTDNIKRFLHNEPTTLAGDSPDLYDHRWHPGDTLYATTALMTRLADINHVREMQDRISLTFGQRDDRLHAGRKSSPESLYDDMKRCTNNERKYTSN